MAKVAARMKDVIALSFTAPATSGLKEMKRH